MKIFKKFKFIRIHLNYFHFFRLGRFLTYIWNGENNKFVLCLVYLEAN